VKHQESIELGRVQGVLSLAMGLKSIAYLHDMPIYAIEKKINEVLAYGSLNQVDIPALEDIIKRHDR
jgi:hypothetical protein